MVVFFASINVKIPIPIKQFTAIHIIDICSKSNAHSPNRLQTTLLPKSNVFHAEHIANYTYILAN